MAKHNNAKKMEEEQKAVNGNQRKSGKANIMVVGIGGGGSNSAARAALDLDSKGINLKDNNIDVYLLNTDNQSLERHREDSKLSKLINMETNVEDETTNMIALDKHGLGGGAKPSEGERFMRESIDSGRLNRLFYLVDVEGNLVKKNDENQVIERDLVVCMNTFGKATGTGGGHVFIDHVTEILPNVLPISIVTFPFQKLEGQRAWEYAEEGYVKLKKNPKLKTLVIYNDDLKKAAELMENKKWSTTELFKLSDKVLSDAVTTIVDIITTTGIVNVDFRDVCTILEYGSNAFFSCGQSGSENNKVDEIVDQILNNPMYGRRKDGEGTAMIQGAKGILAVFYAKHEGDIMQDDLEEISSKLREQAYDGSEEEPHIVYGIAPMPSLQENVLLARIIATGFDAGIRQYKSNIASAGRGIYVVVPKLADERTDKKHVSEYAKTGPQPGLDIRFNEKP